MLLLMLLTTLLVYVALLLLLIVLACLVIAFVFNGLRSTVLGRSAPAMRCTHASAAASLAATKKPDLDVYNPARQHLCSIGNTTPQGQNPVPLHPMA